MKKLTTPAGVFGPYSSIAMLTDRYRVDGADLPFSVVGMGTITDWTDPLPPPITPVEIVPATVSPRQLRQALTAAGLRAVVEAAVSASNQDIKDWWEFASVFERNHPLLNSMAASLGMTTEQVDSVFIAAAKL